MALKEQLTDFANKSKEMVPEEFMKVMLEAWMELSKSWIDEQIVSVWEVFPQATLLDVHGQEVELQSLLKNGPTIVSFYRWGWCPYCNLELKALQEILQELEQYGAQLIAISPETPDSSISTKEKNELDFPVLSDVWNILSKKLRLTFGLKEEIIDIYKQLGIDVDAHNGDTLHEIPLPATYIVWTDWKIIFAHASADYTTRVEPTDLLKYLK